MSDAGARGPLYGGDYVLPKYPEVGQIMLGTWSEELKRFLAQLFLLQDLSRTGSLGKVALPRASTAKLADVARLFFHQSTECAGMKLTKTHG